MAARNRIGEFCGPARAVIRDRTDKHWASVIAFQGRHVGECRVEPMSIGGPRVAAADVASVAATSAAQVGPESTEPGCTAATPKLLPSVDPVLPRQVAGSAAARCCRN